MVVELRDFGWFDDEDKKLVIVSLEGEFSFFFREIFGRMINL